MENNIKIERRGEKILKFFKKYGYFIAAGLVVVAITLFVILTSMVPDEVIDDNVDDVNAGAITFINPLQDGTILVDYSIDKLIYNQTMGWFETHSGIDFVSEDSTDVLASCAGTVTNVYTNSLEGTVVKIKHDDQYSTLYGSLNENVTVEIGDKVTAGQKIGTYSNSAGNESSIGEHLYFELIKDDEKVNPNDYLDLGDK
ncbi:MAG: M23 family metallopeptidase [Clostridia bacterium]|nr:M23 family metallopeptidase [Clostridia bacterium]